MMTSILRLSWVAGLVSAGVISLQAEVTEGLNKEFPLSKDGVLRVDNVNGPIRVTVWDQSTVKLRALKRAKNEADLKRAEIDIQAAPNRIEIKTRHIQQRFRLFNRGNSVEVEYDLTVPRSAVLEEVKTVNGQVTIENAEGRINASTVNGSVAATGVRSTVKMEAVNGRIELRVADQSDLPSISLSTVNGGIELKVPANANGYVEASTVNGGIHNDFGLSSNRKPPLPQEVKGRIGSGGSAKINLSTVNGSISLSKNESIALEK